MRTFGRIRHILISGFIWRINRPGIPNRGTDCLDMLLAEEDGSYLAGLKGLGQSQYRPSGRQRQPRTITSPVQKDLPMPGSV